MTAYRRLPPLEQRLNAFIKLRRTPVQMQLCGLEAGGD